MNEVLGRIPEKKIMRQLLENEYSDFLAIYGRRRVGKTYLIREYYRDNTIFYCTGVNTDSMEDQLQIFTKALFKAGADTLIPPTNWLQAFTLLEERIDEMRSKKKKVIFIDEISWMDTPRSRFLPAFSHFWNTYCEARNDILLVICGSVSTWILDNVINSKAELHNRHTMKIRLLPFTLGETKEFLTKRRRINMNNKDIAQLYMCTGGIPYYLQSLQPGRSIPQLLEDLFFAKNAILKNEFENLYLALFKNSDMHLIIIDALLSKNMGLTRKQIIEYTGIKSGGTFTKVLRELETCGFMRKIYPIDKRKEDALYRLMDEYTIFHHKFLLNEKIKSGVALFSSNSFAVWSGFAFENLCIRHVDQIAIALGISGVEYEAYSFIDKSVAASKGSQIDMVIDRGDNSVNIIEAKFRNTEYTMTADEAANIRNKVQRYVDKTKTRKNIYKTLITTYGADKNKHYLNVITNELLIDELFV